MACGCATRKTAAAGSGNNVQQIARAAIPHSVLPGESCIFCAEKHVAVAATVPAVGAGVSTIIGELELARRHTVLEFPTVSESIAVLELQACLRGLDNLAKRLSDLYIAVSGVAAKNDPTQKAEDGMQTQLEASGAYGINPFIGEIHACAAYRLAYEIGYMLNNRYMIIGDLTLGAETIIRAYPEAAVDMRDLRHRVQTKRASDIDKLWPELCRNISSRIEESIDAYRNEYAAGLASYLGVANAQEAESR